MVVGLYGILKAGGAYMPLDPAYPAERIAYMLREAGVSILLTQATLKDRLPEWKGEVVCLDAQWQDLLAHPERRQSGRGDGVREPGLHHLYLRIDRPTQRRHEYPPRHLNRLLWMQDVYRLTDSDRVLQKTPFCFDVSVWEFFWPLMIGACLVVARPEGHKDSAYLVGPSSSSRSPSSTSFPRCSTCSWRLHARGRVPVFASRDLQRRSPDGGLAESLLRPFAARLHNLYGPTEAAVDVTYWECRRADDLKTVPIGRPVANTQIYVLDDQLEAVPIGVPGELHIGGVQVARGTSTDRI